MNNINGKKILFFITILVKLASQSFLTAQTRNIEITIHLRGVYESKIDLLSLSGTKQFKPIVKVQGIKNGETAKLAVPKENLPGEFVLRFDYKKKEESSPYPCETNIIINDQDLELWVNPVYCNTTDSTWFQQGERENSAFALFTKENNRKKEKFGILQQFLMKYDDPKSKFYRQGIADYEQRCRAYNQWLDTCITRDKALFVSRIYGLQFVPQINWEGTEKDRMFSVIQHYFDGIDFSDPVIAKTFQLKDWMDRYVNLYGQMATSVPLRDSLIPAAAKTAIEKARQGHPLVYGWMVDYFYKGFESNNIPDGMKVLEPYMNDPNCLTSKRMEIERRLKGIETLLKGSKAPDILLKDTDSSMFELYNYKTSSKYILLLFWSAECPHCQETVSMLYPWQNWPEIQKKVSVIAISLDEIETEVKAWNQKIKELAGWKHLRAVEGVRSKVASDYFVLSTPVMILLNAKTKEIISLPSSLTQLKAELP
jgi:thiol-disulfide isomerase/thioredoxin